ncbi:MAG TPA: YccF domain-containing protein [Tenuifilaceae bacterium]|nr:YccF domain-containing protein [Tenuifilaceae bacterium]HOG72727.1 YccF domain-containing protein [Tenuifilaceae bacterium]HOW20575.1 YccF domain-containing protein [Tenuifilaceae bacterium]HOY71538.1 YccF domain-containing protein [Tenuifilaceae bacterium]HPA67959.1 YccF domain-containing protein [Tenuifilaceae bacterium]
MRTLGNILWHFPFLGFLTALGTFLIGGLLVITVIGSPLGLGLIQLSKFLLAPFSNAMVDKTDLQADQNKAWKTYGIIVRILYFPIGLFLVVVNIFQIAGLFISIVGIPVALVLAKSIGTYFNPVNKVCVSKAVADELSSRKAKAEVDKAFATK